MTAIGGIGSSSTERLQMLLVQQTLSATTANSARTDSSTASAASGASGSAGNPNGVAALQELLEEAISEALAGLGEESSAEEVMQAIRDAIDRTLSANGVDIEALRQGPPPPPPEGAMPPEEAGATAAGDRPAIGGPPPGGGGEDGLMAMIDRLLEENGFDPEEIRLELQEAMASAAAGSEGTDATLTLIMQLPLGGGIDTQA